MWVLGTELGASERAASTLNLQAIASDLLMVVLQLHIQAKYDGTVPIIQH